MELKDREIIVLTALHEDGPMTTDEFVSARRLYVNSWAPVFTRLRDLGLAAWTGEQRKTSHGSDAGVSAITPAGIEALG